MSEGINKILSLKQRIIAKYKYLVNRNRLLLCPFCKNFNKKPSFPKLITKINSLVED